MSPPMDANTFEQLRASGELPSPKGVAVAIIRLIQQEEVSIAELARVIAGDPAFVGRVIKAANGLIVHDRRPVASVSEALMVLGLPAVRGVATGFSLLSEYRSGGCKAFDYDAYWAFSLALALGMQVLAQRTRMAAADEAFSLGLLVRVGELALATLYPVEYSKVLEEAGKSGELDLVELEQGAFAMHHAELGVAMVTDWGLPRVFAELVGFYERPETSGYAPGSRPHVLLESLCVARRFAEFCIADDAHRPLLLTQMMEMGERLEVSRENLLFDFRAMFGLWFEWIDLLQLRTDTSRAFPPAESELSETAGSPAGDLRRAFAGAAGVPVALRRHTRVAHWSPDARICVLIIDKDEAGRDEVAMIMRSEDCSVIETADVAEGMDVALELQPHMVVVGCCRDGAPMLDSIRSLRRMRVGQPMHLLMRVAQDGDELLVGALEAGVDDAVPRSAAPRLLAARLRAGLREVRLQRELERDREELRCFAAELAVTNRKLREVALTDALTGFRNRRYAIDRIGQEWSAADRSGRPLSCMVIDLDRLKEINDSSGHDAGDAALTQAAAALRSVLRGQDVICRTGGDEFLAICPGSGLDAATACAERLRKAVSEVVLDLGGRRWRVTVSIGVAERDPSVANVDELMKLADRGAYLAKERGRNAVARVQRDDDV